MYAGPADELQVIVKSHGQVHVYDIRCHF